MEFAPAKRQGIKPLIGIFGKSSGGKTFSALMLARGIVGPAGRIGLIDTENGRGSIFCDVIPGGYEVLELKPPFSPAAYGEAFGVAEEAKFDICVCDSQSHEWIGEGGYLDQKEAALDRMAGNDWKKRDACKFAASAQCKPAHNKLIHRIVRSPMAIILCFRAKDKVKMAKDPQSGKTKVEADDHASPMQDGDFIFEMLIAGEVYQKADTGEGGFFRCTKYTHAGLLECLPRDGEQIGIQHGEAIARWAAAPPKVGGAQKPASVKAALWKLGQSKFGFKTAPDMEAFLYGEGITSDYETLAGMSEERMGEILEKLQQ